MSFKLPPEISISKEIMNNSVGYIFRHKDIGELGKLVVTGLKENTHFASFVSGEPEDPLTKKRQEILEPLTNAMIAEVEKQTKAKNVNIDPYSFTPKVPKKIHQVAAKHLPCPKCNKMVGHLIFADNAENQAEMEDYYRLAYPKIKEMNVPTWVIGKEEIYSPKNIITFVMKVWPKKDETAVKVSFDEFNLMLNKIQNGHCLN